MVDGLLEGGEAAADPPLPAVLCVFFWWCLEVEGICACPGGSAEDMMWQGESRVVSLFLISGRVAGSVAR